MLDTIGFVSNGRGFWADVKIETGVEESQNTKVSFVKDFEILKVFDEKGRPARRTRGMMEIVGRLL